MSALMEVLGERWVLTLATNALDGSPHVAPLFFAVGGPTDSSPGPSLLFISRPSTTHGVHLGLGPTAVAAAVYLETERVGEIRGVQMRGWSVPVQRLPASQRGHARALYLKRHPIAADALTGDPEDPAAHWLYCLGIGWAKLTDNRLGFGVHPEWSFAHPWPEMPKTA